MAKKIILKQTFFEQKTERVAKELLGKYLVRKYRGKELAFVINETEAYVGAHDMACHGHRGKTPRNSVMFGPAGHWYVYLTYGTHYMVNIVTELEGRPTGVLLRGAGDIVGPGRLTKALHIDMKLRGLPSRKASHLWIEDRGVTPARDEIVRTPRIGVNCPDVWKEKPLRFVWKNKSTA